MRMDVNQLQEIIDRYLEGCSTEAEKSWIEGWLEEQRQKPTDLKNSELSQLKKSTLSQIFRQLNTRPVIYHRIQKWLRPAVAAAVLVFMGLLAFFFAPKRDKKMAASISQPVLAAAPYQYYATAKNQIRKIVLPDSSLVWLNSSSSLRIPSRFSSTGREVYLDEGEAFFKVKHDAFHPFRVNCGKATVQDIGTSFNVKAYDKLEKIVILVKTGKVNVSNESGVRNQLPLQQTLLPSEGITIDTKNNSYYSFRASPRSANAWLNGSLQFKQNSMEEVLLALENKFDILFINHIKRPEKCSFTASFAPNNTLPEIMDALCLALNLTYHKKGSIIIIKGPGCL